MELNNRNQNPNPYGGYGNEQVFNGALASCMTRVFVRMFAALVITALSAVVVVLSPTLQDLIFESGYGFFVLVAIELGLVLAISAGINKMSSSTAGILFFIYALVNGLTLSVIFFAYALPDIYVAFGVCAAMFAVTAAYGAITKKNLATVGGICIMALIGLIIATVVNIFLRSEMMEMLISYVGVLIFVGLTAYDTQRVKSMLAQTSTLLDGEEVVRKVAITGALALYLDFVNMFLMLLRIFGRRD